MGTIQLSWRTQRDTVESKFNDVSLPWLVFLPLARRRGKGTYPFTYWLRSLLWETLRTQDFITCWVQMLYSPGDREWFVLGSLDSLVSLCCTNIFERWVFDGPLDGLYKVDD
jgi:hypothetical protein